MSNLRFLREASITSSSSALDVTDVFSTDFDIYKLKINKHQSDSQQELALRYINSSGSVVTSSLYDVASELQTSYSNFVAKRETNHDSFDFFGFNNTNVHMGGTYYIYLPSKSDCYTFGYNEIQSFVNGSSGLSYKGINILKENSTITGFRLFGDDGHNISQLNVKVYGIRKD